MSVSISMTEMLKAGVHYGHKKSRWDPRMKQYIYGDKNNIHVIDLNKCVLKFADALSFLKDQASMGKTILFVGTKPQALPVVKETADKCEMPYVVTRWLGGTLTNFSTIKTRLKTLKDLENKLRSGGFEGRTKKEILDIERDIEKMNATLGGIKNMTGIPDVMFITDIKMDSTAIKEAKSLGITLVGISDTNNNPHLLDYVIPGNDDSVKSLAYIFKKLEEAVLEGKANPKKKEEPKTEEVKKEEPKKQEPKEETVKKEEKEVAEEKVDKPAKATKAKK